MWVPPRRRRQNLLVPPLHLLFWTSMRFGAVTAWQDV